MAKKQYFHPLEHIDKIKHPFIAGGGTIAKTDVEVTTGTGVLEPGTIMAVDTTTGKIGQLKDSGNNGEDVARYILAEEIDLANDKTALVYDMGVFFKEGLIYPAEFKNDDTKKEKARRQLEEHKIYIRRYVK